MIDAVSAVLILLGLGFYLAGSIGLLRLPDLYSRLHALTKADNLGLGLLSAGLALLSQDLFTAAKLLLIWLAVLAASATSATTRNTIAAMNLGRLWPPAIYPNSRWAMSQVSLFSLGGPRRRWRASNLALRVASLVVALITAPPRRR